MLVLKFLLILQLLKISMIDIRTKKIRNKDIFILYLIEMAYLFLIGESVAIIGIRNILALFFLVLSYKYWKHGIGAGDGKLICTAFILLGIWKIYLVCILSMILLFFFIALKYRHKEEWKKQHIPLAPFICSSVLVMLLI